MQNVDKHVTEMKMTQNLLFFKWKKAYHVLHEITFKLMVSFQCLQYLFCCTVTLKILAQSCYKLIIWKMTANILFISCRVQRTLVYTDTKPTYFSSKTCSLVIVFVFRWSTHTMEDSCRRCATIMLELEKLSQ